MEQDLFAPVREILELFVTNCITAYVPHPTITIDEQLLPMKNRCKIIQYIATKPDKFGIKLWVASGCY